MTSSFNLRSMTTTSVVDLHRIFSTIGLYDHKNTSTVSSTLNDSTLDGSDSNSNFGSNSSSSSSSSSSNSSSASATGKDEAANGLSAAAATSIRFVFRWYALIAILSVLVVTGIVFAVCRLSIKAEAYRKSGIGTHQDGLLFSEYSRAAGDLTGSLDVDGSNDL